MTDTLLAVVASSLLALWSLNKLLNANLTEANKTVELLESLAEKLRKYRRK